MKGILKHCKVAIFCKCLLKSFAAKIKTTGEFHEFKDTFIEKSAKACYNKSYITI